MSEAFLGEIRIFPYNFAPRNWADCNGQLMAISSNTALFSLLGTTYGGDGRTTFALPDLRGRVPIHLGQGPGLPSYDLGEKDGAPTTTLTQLELPSHNHTAVFTPSGGSVPVDINIPCNTSDGNTNNPSDATFAVGLVGRSLADVYTSADPDATMKAFSVDIPAGGAGNVTVENTGGSLPFNILQPFLTLRFCICVAGIYPTRN